MIKDKNIDLFINIFYKDKIIREWVYDSNLNLLMSWYYFDNNSGRNHYIAHKSKSGTRNYLLYGDWVSEDIVIRYFKLKTFI